MLEIELKGGLGNQMFQYAFARKVALIDKKRVIFDLSFFNKTLGKSTTERSYGLSNFNIIDIKIIDNIRTSKAKEFLTKVTTKLRKKLGVQKEEYFQSEKYFKDIETVIRKEFTLKESLPPTAQIYKEQILSSKDSISLHIRRGDYISNVKANLHHGFCDLSYYEKAIFYIKEKIESPTFFIFSDDIQWVKENLKIENIIFVSNSEIKDYEELILMSECAHHIIANSTFSWWGAWLNPDSNKIVIAPQQWITQKTSKELDILPKEWVKL